MSSKDKKDQKDNIEKKKDEKKTDLGSLEEDDDFEEFPMEGLLEVFSFLKFLRAFFSCKVNEILVYY